eukprot:TRINITY_DN109224_c0_g1_i1.p1 TRINITY_DN109224_c0_g1~~TRINITY_DN109224_c0_g1_i1.p1  ORF type:complete len:304 (+),score=69.54 TRINITY_DN109224_c0_g1_i1:24-914(+)
MAVAAGALWGWTLRTVCRGRGGLRVQRVFSTAGGDGVLRVGKLKGMKFEDCYATDPSYCSWILKRGEELPAGYSEFLAFLRAKTQAASDAPPSSGMFAGHAAVHDVASGEQSSRQPVGGLSEELLGFGKYKASTYAEVISQDPRYCQWVREHNRSEAGKEASPAFKAFGNYLEGIDLPEGEGGRFRGGAHAAPPPAAAPSPSPSAAPGRYRSGGAAFAASSSGARPGREKPGPLVDGKWPVTFGGKYKDWTFAEVLQKDKEYCEYIVNLVLAKEEQVSADMLAFTVYVQHQAMQIE